MHTSPFYIRVYMSVCMHTKKKLMQQQAIYWHINTLNWWRHLFIINAFFSCSPGYTFITRQIKWNEQMNE